MKKILMTIVFLSYTSPSLAQESVALLQFGESVQDPSVSGLQDWVDEKFIVFEYEAQVSRNLGTFYSEEADVSVQWVPTNQLMEKAKDLFSSYGGGEAA